MTPLIDPELDRYAEVHSTPPHPLLRELQQYTQEHCRYPEMIIGPLEGALLAFLVHLVGARRVLEIGTFTGYSALSMAAALPADGELITCEIDDTHADIAQSFFDRSELGARISLRRGAAADSLASLTGPFDMVFLDADKESYSEYYAAVLPLMRPGGILAADNVLWSGRVLRPRRPVDRAIVQFNAMVRSDPAVENVLLTVRDGLLLVRKL